MSPDSFARPTRLCDLVMKGGITSGVVYPLAVCELAKLYTFKNIGGTSAGAIAAAAAAAAEYGRRNGAANPAGFEGLAELPGSLGQPGRLLKLFKPDASVRSLFALATATMKARTTPRIVVAVAGQLLRTFWLIAILIGLTAGGIDYWLLTGLMGAARIYLFVSTFVLALILFFIVVAFLLYRQITHAIPANFYGLSKAFDKDVDVATADAPLTNWLTRYLNELAGKPLEKGLLTFGDLYSAPRPPGDPDPDEAGYRAINLEMMTTALSHGRPYRLPFRDPDRVFYFSPLEFSTLFPRTVVDHMITHARTSDKAPPRAEGCDRLYGFPDAQNLPVVVATRMSLSFPVLLSAVPLYAVDFTRAANKDHTKSHVAERCWFSDGGICSNLPIHFFDAPMPRWPTFGINLKQFHPEHQEEDDAVFLPPRANTDTLLLWNRFEKPGGFGLFSNFLFAILNTTQNWQDNTQSRVPGYRDRLVHVSQREDEGGLNLDMLPETIAKLSQRGQRAGAALVRRFGETSAGPSAGWPEHRWVRLRSSMAVTIDLVRRLVRGYGNPVPADPTYEKLLTRGADDPPDLYRLGDADQPRAKTVVDAFVDMSEQWDQNGTGGLDEGPRPTPELRIRPRI